MAYLDLVLATTIFLGLFVLFRRALSRSHPLPPGRKGWPLIGNALEIPAKCEWKTYHQWCKELNTNILHLNAAGTHLIILDTLETATDLLDKRSSIYSGRFVLPMLTELMGWGYMIPFMNYGSEWRQHRRLMEQQLHSSSTRQFHPHLLKTIRRMLNKFLDNPESDVLEVLRHMVGEIVMSIGYGLDVQSHNDPYIATAQKTSHIISEAAVPGAYFVDYFPILKYVPEWFPGAGFKKHARESRKVARRMIEVPYAATKKNIESGEFEPSFVSLNLQKMNEGSNPTLYNEQNIKEVAATIYAGGSDTSLSALGSCILALLHHPEVVAKAQEELDRVLQPGRLPDFEDEKSLPYITAIAKEALRWREVTPIGFPHLLNSDDVYRGYRIPAGSLIVPNVWAILHDEKVYPDPFTFKPERFLKDGVLDPSVLDPEMACWGFGRRICPGRHLAYSSIWIAIASLLTVFDVKKSVNSEGNIIEPLDETIVGVVSIPKPFKCSITPRTSERAKNVLESYRH